MEGDEAFYYLHRDGELNGTVITHVDDFIPWNIEDGPLQAQHLNSVFIDMDDHAVFTVTGRKINRTDIDRT